MQIFENLNCPTDSELILRCVYSVLITNNPRKTWKALPRTFDVDTIFYIHEGEYFAYLGDRKIHVKPHDVLYIPSQTLYSAQSISAGFTFQGIHFSAWKENPQDYFSTFHYWPDCKNLHNKFMNLNTLSSSDQFCRQLSLKRELYDLLSQLQQKQIFSTHQTDTLHVLRSAIHHMENNYASEEINVNYLADLCNITPTYFAQLFRQVYGVSPKEYLIKKRMEKAREYLLYSTYSILEISKALGYSNPAYFSAAFKKLYGTSPSDFRRK